MALAPVPIRPSYLCPYDYGSMTLHLPVKSVYRVRPLSQTWNLRTLKSV